MDPSALKQQTAAGRNPALPPMEITFYLVGERIMARLTAFGRAVHTLDVTEQFKATQHKLFDVRMGSVLATESNTTDPDPAQTDLFSGQSPLDVFQEANASDTCDFCPVPNPPRTCVYTPPTA